MPGLGPCVRWATALVGAGALLSAATGGALAATSRPPASRHTPRSVYHSPYLWATINACNPKDHPNTVGIRGSMPGDGRAGETMYMRFRIQYLDPATNSWRFVAQRADSGWLPVGSATYRARQAGRSFQIVPTAGQAYTMRGAVSFEWRRGSTYVLSARIHTTAGHRDAQGADPKGYTAATCQI